MLLIDGDIASVASGSQKRQDLSCQFIITQITVRLVPLTSLYLSPSIASILSSLAPWKYSFSPIFSPVWYMFNGSVPDLNFVVSCLTVLCRTVLPFKYSLIKWLQSHPCLACVQKNWDRPADLTPFDIFIHFFFTNWNFCFIWLICFFRRR